MKEIELLNHETQAFMGRVPSVLIRQGTTWLLLLTNGLLIGSSLFIYPNVVKAPVSIKIEKLSETKAPGSKRGKAVGLVKLKPVQVGRIQKGQKAILVLSKFTSEEHGHIEGTVLSISNLISTNKCETYYEARISLTPVSVMIADQLIQDGSLHGDAEIITSETSFLSRIIQPLQPFNPVNN